MTDVPVVGNPNPGTAGTEATLPGQAGGNGGPGGNAIATNATSTDPINTAEATGGNGGAGGFGGSGNAASTAGGPAGAGGNGGAAQATTTTSTGSAGGSSAGATASGGSGGRAGDPGLSFPVGSGSGHGADGGTAGTATATASDTNPTGYASATAIATGGAGGSSYGTGYAGQAGGVASGSTATASGTGAYAKVKQTGGHGGGGSGGASGGNGTNSALINAATGTTTGGALKLKQYAYGGAGGGTYHGTSILAGANPGHGGSAKSYLTATDTTGASSVKTYARAVGGVGGAAYGGTGASGGAATAYSYAGTHSTGSAGIQAFATADGGKGGSYYTGSTANGGAGGDATGATAKAIANGETGGTAYAFAAQTGGTGGYAVGIGVVANTGNVGGIGGTASDTYAYAKGYNATARVAQHGGDGGYGAHGASGGAGGNSSLISAAGIGAAGVATGGVAGGTLTLEQGAYGGRGGSGILGSTAGGTATSELTFDDTHGARYLAEYSTALGGAGGSSRAYGGSPGGAANASVDATGADNVHAVAKAAGGRGGGNRYGNDGGYGGIATVTSATAIGSSSNGVTVFAGGYATGGYGYGANSMDIETGGAGANAYISGFSSSEGIHEGVYASGPNALVKSVATGGVGGVGANSGAGGHVKLSSTVGGVATAGASGTLTLEQYANGGAGGATPLQDSGTKGGAGGYADSYLDFNDVTANTTHAGTISGYSRAVGGAGGLAVVGTGGAGGNAQSDVSLIGVNKVTARALGISGYSGGGAPAGLTETVAEATTQPGTGIVTSSLAEANANGGGLIYDGGTFVSVGTTNYSGAVTTAFDRTTNDYTYLTAAPSAANIAPILNSTTNVKADFSLPTTTLLDAVTLGANASTSGFGGQGYSNVIDVTINTTGLSGDIILGLANYNFANAGNGALSFKAGLVGDPYAINQSFTTLNGASALLGDSVIDLGAIDGATSVEVQVTIGMTTGISNSGAAFGDQVLLGIACFAEGTRIATARGAVCVEELREGDIVNTRDGTQPVVWIGHRTLDLARHPAPEAARPIRIARHAFGRNLPARALLVSPDHAIYWNGALVPAKHLLNGRTITQERPRAVTYFHVELPTHDIIFADGLSAESYLDTGNRAMFANADIAMLLHPKFPIRHWSDTCAPLVLEGEALAAIRRHLLARAENLGHATTEEPDLHLRADRRRVEAQILADGRLRLAVPKGAREISLVSNSGVARELLEASDDARRLGVCVGQIEIATPSGAFEMALDDPALGAGWHPAEAGWRWTDGDARLDIKGPCLLHVTLAGAMKFPARRRAA